MGIGIGILLIALGAILKFAVHVRSGGIDLPTVGVILMAAGALGVLIDLVILMPRRARYRRETVRRPFASDASARTGAVIRDETDSTL
jgi:hypothetical protein